MKGKKWTLSQHAKYRATMKRKRDGKKPIDAEVVDVTPKLNLNDAVDHAWANLCLGDKLAALAHVWNSVAGD